MLDQRGRLGFGDVADRRSLLVNFRIVPRRGMQVLRSEGGDVRIHVVGHPVGDSRAHRDSLEAVARCRDERGNVSALAPAHRAHALLVHPALGDQRIYPGNHIGIIADAEIANVQGAEFLAVTG